MTSENLSGRIISTLTRVPCSRSVRERRADGLDGKEGAKCPENEDVAFRERTEGARSEFACGRGCEDAPNSDGTDQGIEARIGDHEGRARSRGQALRRVSARSESDEAIRKVRSGLFDVRQSDGEGIREDGREDLSPLASSGCRGAAGRGSGSPCRNRPDHALLQARKGDGRRLSHMERIREGEEGVQSPERESERPRSLDSCARRFRTSFDGRRRTRTIRGLHRPSRPRKRFDRARSRMRVDARQREDAAASPIASFGEGESIRATSRDERRQRPSDRVRHDIGRRGDGSERARTSGEAQDEEANVRIE